MSTFNSEEIINSIISNDGYDPEDHGIRYIKVVEYTNYAGNICWGAILNVEVPLGMIDRYEHPTDHIRNPEVIWTCSDYEYYESRKP